MKTKFEKIKTLLATGITAALVSCTPGKNSQKEMNALPLAFLANGEKTYSESNYQGEVLAEVSMGPGTSVSPSELTTTTPAELLGNFSSNIADGATDVVVNQAVQVTLANGFQATSTGSGNSYIVDSQGTVLYSRISIDGNTLTLIPQIRLQPGKSYTAIIGGVQAADGTSYGDIKISYTNADLDYGLYWYGKFGLCEKYIPGIENAFYSPEQKTVVFAHGWQAGSVTSEDVYGRVGYKYEMFYMQEDNFGGASGYNGLEKWTNHAWIDDAWNTGIVYWNQFADEPSTNDGNFLGVQAAEAKIWNLQDGPNGPRYRVLLEGGNAEYRNWDGKLIFKGQQVQVASIGQLLSLYVVDALQANTSGNIRLVGHSLGNQVATYLAGEVDKAGIAINRISLLDPAWTGGEKNYLPIVSSTDTNVTLNHNGAKALDSSSQGSHFWVSEYARVILFKVMNSQWSRGIAVDRYNSTLLNASMPIMTPNRELSEQIAVTDVMPWYYGSTQIGQKHVVIRHHYFWTMEVAAPIECTVRFWRRSKTGDVAISAATSESRIREMMLDDYYRAQVEGRNTPDPADDWFEKKRK
ncbi:MAG: Ig-like domain-containing protein [Spirochaetota bacterium]